VTDSISDALVNVVSAAFLLTEVFVILIEVVVSLQFGRLVFRCVEGAEKSATWNESQDAEARAANKRISGEGLLREC